MAVDRFTYTTVCEDSGIFLMQDKLRRNIQIPKQMGNILYNLIRRKDCVQDNPVYDETVVDMLINRWMITKRGK